LLASYMKQGLPEPNLAVDEAESTKRQNADDYEAIRSRTSGLT